MPGETGSVPGSHLDSPRQTFSEGPKFILSFCLSFSLSLPLSLYHSSVSFLSVTFCLCLVVFLSSLPATPPAFFCFFSLNPFLSPCPRLSCSFSFLLTALNCYFFLLLTLSLFLLSRPVSCRTALHHPVLPALLCTSFLLRPLSSLSCPAPLHDGEDGAPLALQKLLGLCVSMPLREYLHLPSLDVSRQRQQQQQQCPSAAQVHRVSRCRVPLPHAGLLVLITVSECG